MLSDDFYPNKIRRSKLYLDATIKDVKMHYPVKKSLFRTIKKYLLKVFFK